MGLLGLALTLASSAKADYAYIGYYHSDQVTQLTIGSGGNTTITSGTTFATGFAPEMITQITNLPGANPNQLFIVNTSGGTVESFSPTGTVLSTNILKDANGNSITLGGMAGATLSSNGQDYYVAASNNQGINASGGSNASGIYEFSTTTGKEVGFTAFTDAHDITFHNGLIYATAYQASGTAGITGNAGVWTFNANLTGGTQIIAPSQTGAAGTAPTGANSNDLYNATGMAFVGNNLYVGNAAINNGVSGQSFVQEYSINTAQTMATYVQTYMDASNIVNPFGLTTGPDGNVYVSSLGNVPSGGSNPGQITELNVSAPASSALSVWLASGATDGNGVSPKYLSFTSEAVTFVPEPSSYVMMGLGLGGVALMARSQRRKPAIAA